MKNLFEKIKTFFSSIPGEICKPEMKLWEKILSGITFVFDCIYRILLEFSKVILLVVVIIVSAQVFARFFGKGIMWSEEVALLFMVWIAFIALAIGVEKDLHISITVFFNLFPKTVQKILLKVIQLAIIFFGMLLIIYGIMLVQNSMNNKLPATQWPNGIKFIFMPVSGVFVCYFGILNLLGLNRFRHLNIEDGHRGDEKTDQQIVEEMQLAKKEKSDNSTEDKEEANV